MNAPETDIRAILAARSDWSTLTAYEMTKQCCDEMTKRGQRVPSWTVIRDIIGKGSAGDINRGKDDYRREHGDTLRKMSGFVQGVPEALAPHIMGFWTEAIDLVRREFETQVGDWQSKLERADAAVAQAESERDKAINRVEALLAKINGLQENNLTLQGHIETEQAARQQAERMFESSRLELAGQRDSLRAALEKSQLDFSAAITRLEGVERHALMEIERARVEAQQMVASIEAKAKRERDDSTMEMTRVKNQLRDIRLKLDESERRAAALDRDNEALRERVQRAEMQTDQLAKDNSRLVTTINKSSTAPPRVFRNGGTRKPIRKLR